MDEGKLGSGARGTRRQAGAGKPALGLRPAWRAGAALAVCLGLAPPTHAVDRVSAPALFNGRAMLEIDGTQRFLRSGQTSPEGVRLISSTAKLAIIEIDGVRREIPLGGRVGGTISRHKPRLVQVWPDQASMYWTNGEVNGRSIRFLIDTGATSVVFNSVDASRLGLRYLDGQRGMASTASGMTPTWRLMVDRMRVGGIEVDGVAVSVIEGAFPEEPLLGMSFLSRIGMRREGTMLELSGN